VNWQDRENPQAGGAETHLHEIFGRIAAKGERVTLLCSGFPGAPPHTKLDGIEVHRVGERHTFPLHARRYFQRSLRPAGFDVIVEDLNKVTLFTPRWSDTPVVLLVHHLFGGIAFQEASLPIAALTWVLELPVPREFKRVPVIAVSESTADDLVRRGFDRSRIHVIPNAVDLQALRPDPSGSRVPDPTVLFIGRLKRYKSVNLVIDAVATIRADGVPVKLLIAGKGDRRAKLEAQAQRLRLEDSVRFLGFVSEAEKVELLSRSWVHVLASPKEGWGIANLEAAACGTPTVASDSPGLRDSVLNGRTGYLVPHGDVPALAARIRELLVNPAERDRMGREARAFAETFSWDSSAEQVLEVLRAAAGRGPGPGVA
jgi:glycosyltransferase involved in cell wall biosynthesis